MNRVGGSPWRGPITRLNHHDMWEVHIVRILKCNYFHNNHNVFLPPSGLTGSSGESPVPNIQNDEGHWAHGNLQNNRVICIRTELVNNPASAQWRCVFLFFVFFSVYLKNKIKVCFNDIALSFFSWNCSKMKCEGANEHLNMKITRKCKSKSVAMFLPLSEKWKPAIFWYVPRRS